MMKNLNKARVRMRLQFLIAALFGVVALSGLWAAPARALPASSGMTITVTNNSSREIRSLYLSPVDRDNWTLDLLNGNVLRIGQSYSLNDVSCAGNEIKIIAEDPNGCFVYGVVGCSQASISWTITNDLPLDCGN